MPLFTGAYANPLNPTPHPAMQAAVSAARGTLALAGAPNINNIALIVVALTGFTGAPNHPWAGFREREEHYSGSLLKIAAMYVAFDLRASADQLATQGGLSTWAQVEAALKSTFDPEIDAHTPSLISGSTLLRPQDKSKKPNYATVLQMGTGADFVVDFTPAQLNAFEDMMVQQNNPGATTTIHGLGYPCLNGKIANDGFFDGASRGMWLAGDYAQQWPAARIPCVNDVDTAQGTTVWDLAKLLTLLADDKLVGPLSSRGMKALMARAGKFFHQDSPPIWPTNGRLVATHGKVGIGRLKSNKPVLSEGLIVRDTLRGTQFVAVWQNVIQDGQPQRTLLEPVAALIEAAISAFSP
jgi:hypothetical protein